ncbi:MAG TPA: 7TM diverse intracellular signaling domain-containing protein [Bacteroidia bacterium]|nr:7TM diverse intracellular signaling domain-containing protein [Bacteroidia bacterium]
MKKALILSLLAIHACFSFAQNNRSNKQNIPIVISPADGGMTITDQVFFYNDDKSNLSFKAIQAVNDWQSSEKNSLNFGYNTNAHWIKFSLIAAHESPLLKQYLVINYPVLDSVDIYMRPGAGEFTLMRMGDHYPFSTRQFKYRYFVIPFTLSDEFPTEFYIRLRTESSAQIPLQLWNETSFLHHINVQNYVLGIYYGIIIVMFLYNLFIFFSVRERSYFYYLCFILFFALFQATINGLTYEFLWGDSIWWANNSAIVFAATFLFFIPAFANALLNTKTVAPKMGFVLRILGYLALLNLSCSLLLPYAAVIKSTVLLALVTVLFTVITGFVCLFRGYRAARFFLLAWLGLLTGGFIYALKGFGLLPNNFFTEYGVQMGSAAEVILLSIALADRINMLKREKTEAQEKALVHLESIVKERTYEVVQQKKVVEEKNKDITDSINYALHIQKAFLPEREEIYASFPQSFILFKPKDIVSGDFYFFHKNEHSVFIAAADCTGHGVPGAFMSMIGSERLTDAVQKSNDTSEILSLLNTGVKHSLHQSDKDESTRDGMDIAICGVDTEKRIIKYAGANRPIWIIRKDSNTVEEIKATKKAIGGRTEDGQHFESHEIKLKEGDTFYICTDGYADTFNGQNNKKLTTKKFKELLLKTQYKTMPEQEKYLNEFIEKWKDGIEQVDDILVIGVRL